MSVFAPEFYIGGGKLSLLSGAKAKFSAESLKLKLDSKSPAPPVHRSPAGAISITQATEVGAVYSIDEIRYFRKSQNTINYLYTWMGLG